MANTPLDDVPIDLTRRVCIMAGQKRPFAEGGLANIWLGILDAASLDLPSIGDELSATDKKVAIKVLRCAQETTKDVIVVTIKRLGREVRVWKGLSHPNVLPMYGTCDPARLGEAFDPRLKLLISPYCKNGNVQAYLTSHPNAANKRHLLRGTLEGLAYLHSKHYVHGDIKPVNILIDDLGHARLTDFGLSRIVDETGFTTKNPAVTLCYSAPELLDTPLPDEDNDEDEDEDEGPERPLPKITPATDIWAFGMTAMQILSGDFLSPFKGPYASVVQIVRNKGIPRRARYKKIADADWEILRSCWAYEADRRCRIEHLLGNFA